jgi:putative DNA primase/helicase
MENNHNFSPNKGQRKDREFNGNESIKINPDFSELINPKTFLSHFEQLKKIKEVSVPHKDILAKLIEQIKLIDFEELANPDKLEDFTLKEKHFLILSIENILSIAENQHWGICKNNEFIYLYNGTFWTDIDQKEFYKFLGEAAERMGVNHFTASHFLFREKLLKQFLATAYLPKPESKNDTVLINLMNGTFEINPQGTRIRPFDSSDFITYQLPFEYNPNAKAPSFEAYLNRVLPDKERQRILAEYLGFVFIKHGSNALKEEKALILYGTGANGKSVFFEVVNALLGAENVSSFSLQNLTNDNGYFRAKMANKLVNYASEINGNLEASIFKQLVSGEPVDARLPYGQPFMMKQYAKLIFNCNELPKDVEHTNAYFRRFLIIPFDVTIPEAEQDKNLHSKIIENELSGVFNWVLEGLNRLLDQKRFSICEAARLAVEQYKIESNSIRLFLDESGYKISTEYTRLKDLYPEYRLLCMEDGMKPFSKRNFSKQLQSMGFVFGRESGTGQNIVYLKKEGAPF